MKNLKRWFYSVVTFTACSSAVALTSFGGPQSMEFKPKVLWQTPPSPMQTSEPFTPLCHFKDSTFLVWVDANWRPWVTQLDSNGTPTTVPLDNNPDYTAQPDGHHRFSLGVDKLGYIHITGDMHHYFDGTTGVIHDYPARYQKQTILYWKSNQPMSVSGGFSFAGQYGSATAIPGSGWMSGRFFTDNNGELYYSSQVHAYEAADNSGQMAVGLYKYDTSAKTWTAIGGVAPMTKPYISHQEKVFY